MGQVKKPEVQEAILRAAFRLFTRKGYAQTTIAEIAARAKVSTANVYVYFASKLEILYAIYDPWMRERLARLEREVAAIDDPYARVRHILQTMWRDVPAEENGFVNNIMQAIAAYEPGEGYRPTLLRWMESRLDALLRGSLPEDRRPAVAAADLAHLVVMAFDGFILYRRLDPQRPCDDATLDLVAGLLLGRGDRPAPRTRGPAVWLDMDQHELDAAYDQERYAPNLPQIVQRYATLSAAARERIGEPRRFSYGATPVEALDVYPTTHALAPIHVFVHGGRWRGGAARDYAFPAELFVHAGAHYIALDFVNVLEAGGDLVPMADQVRRALAWVYRNAERFGGDRERIYLSGHSSGAHLAAVALTTDWKRDFGVPANVIRGAVLASGMYDLAPVRRSARSSYVKFTDATEAALSPQRHLARIRTPVVVAYGTLETPEFQRQARDFAAALGDAGKPVELLVGEGYNHFELAETLASPYSLLGRAALKQMKLGSMGRDADDPRHSDRRTRAT